MVRPSHSERRNEKFVQWKEPLQSEGDTTRTQGPDSARIPRKNRPTTSQKSLLTSLAASVQIAGDEEAEHATSSTVEVVQTGIGTSSLPVAVANSSPPAPAPRFKPHRQMQNMRPTSQNRRSIASNGAVQKAAERIPEMQNRRAGQSESIQQHSDSEEHDEEDTVGPPHRRDIEGLLRTEQPSGRAVPSYLQTAVQGQQSREYDRRSGSQGGRKLTTPAGTKELRPMRTHVARHPTNYRESTTGVRTDEQVNPPRLPNTAHIQRSPACRSSRSPVPSVPHRTPQTPVIAEQSDQGNRKFQDEYVKKTGRRSHPTWEQQQQTFILQFRE